MNPSPLQVAAAVLFALAVVHTFCTKFFERLAHRQPRHAGLWHLLGEVEVVFGFWAFVLAGVMVGLEGTQVTTAYLDSRQYTEPLFVFAIMVMAGTRPVMQASLALVSRLARTVPGSGRLGLFFVILTVLPLLGSLLTEPAAMTLAALMLSQQIFSQGISLRLRYATLGVLLVNISIGGTLTHFAAPPVLMVAGPWNWDTPFMLTNIGWKAALAVGVNATLLTAWGARELRSLPPLSPHAHPMTVPASLMLIHGMLIAGAVAFAHHPPILMGLFLMFLGIAHAYRPHQDALLLREGLLVAFFLAGLVVLGGQQTWWLQPLLLKLSPDAVFLGAIGLTAITDNAALTYLASLVTGLSDSFKYALVTGAITGGGLTIIANAPNPAGIALLRQHFHDHTVHPGGLLLAAILPTLIAALAFKCL